MNQKCPCCGEWEVIYIDHEEEFSIPHLYCKNCDWGICIDC